MRQLAGLPLCVLVLAACGAGASPSPSASSGALSLRVTSLSTDRSGFRHATIAVTARGPLVVNPTYCGRPAPVTLWAVDSRNRRLPDDTAYPQYCQLPTTQAIPVGVAETYSGTVGWPASAGPVKLHGELALASGHLILPILSIPAP